MHFPNIWASTVVYMGTGPSFSVHYHTRHLAEQEE